MVKASASRAGDLFSIPALSLGDFFPGRVISVTSKLVLQWLPCQAPGDTGSALGLVGPVHSNAQLQHVSLRYTLPLDKFFAWLLYVPATCLSISGTGLPR